MDGVEETWMDGLRDTRPDPNETKSNGEIAEAASATGQDRIVHFLEYQRERVNQANSVKRFTTGLNQLDGLLEGFETGELNVISGPTGSGKTLLADSIGQRLMRKEGMRIAWFSYEVSTEKMISKYVHSEDNEALGLYVPMELKTGDIGWLKKKCLEAQLQHGCQAVIIDHLHFLVDMHEKHNMSLNIGGVMRQLKHEVAKGMNLIVFIISHQGQPRPGEDPSIDNIRDSSFIGQEADNVLVVFRAPDPVPAELEGNTRIKGYERTFDEGLAFVKIEKARRAGTFRKKIRFRKEGEYLEETL